MSVITNDGSEIINRKIESKFIQNDMLKIENFEIDSTVKWIEKNNFKKVGLQFPDELLPISVQIYLHLKNNVNCQFGIMADTSYGNCCVDEVGGEHFSVEAIVHYGNACLNLTHKKIPVKYIFGKHMFKEIDILTDCKTVTRFIQTEYLSPIEKCITILYEFKYMDYCKDLSEQFKKDSFCVYNSYPNLPEYINNVNIINCQVFGSRLVQQGSNEDTIVLFIGDNYDYSVKTTLISMFYLYKKMIMFSPAKNTIKNISIEIQRFLRSRLFSIEVAKDAKRVGLLVGTLSIENYLEIYQYLNDIMKKSGKAVYPMVVGKINSHKLANFADLDVLVVINCTESCLQFSDKNDDYYRPIVTPYEMICACNSAKFSNPFTSQYLIDFKDLLKEENRFEGNLDTTNQLETSLITGKIINCSLNDKPGCGGNPEALVSRLDSEWCVSAIDRSTRSWYGLDPQLGKTEVSKIKDGRSGIAAGYENELK